jgi:hypothetical protein
VPIASHRVLELARRIKFRYDHCLVVLLDDANDVLQQSLGRTQQRIELQEKTANFHCMKRDAMVRYVIHSRGAFSNHISYKALSGAPPEIEFRECAVLYS